MAIRNGAGAAAAESVSEAQEIADAASSEPTKRQQSWRDVLPVHPAAELFPMMSKDELRELANDIKTNALREKADIYRDPVIGDCVLDGRNRLDALELIGQLWDQSGELNPDTCKLVGSCSIHYPNFDPYAHVISRNIRRRHLTAEQRRDLIEKVLKAKPGQSNRQIAKQTKADDKTVAKVRRELESTAEIPQLEKTTGADGKQRKQPKRKPAVQETFDSPQEAHCAKPIPPENPKIGPSNLRNIFLMNCAASAQVARYEGPTSGVTKDMLDAARATVAAWQTVADQLECMMLAAAADREDDDDLTIPGFLRRGAA
jgi:hypothetical protein